MRPVTVRAWVSFRWHMGWIIDRPSTNYGEGALLEVWL